MKKLKKFLSPVLFFQLVLLLSLPLSISAQTENPPLILGTGHWEPYTYTNQTERGLITELVTQVFREMKREIKIVFYPWKRCELAVEKGEIWAAFPYVPTLQRAQKFLFSDPIYYSQSKFFSYADQKISYQKIEELKKYKIGGTLGHFYQDFFKEKGLRVQYALDDEMNLHKLRKKRVDLVAMDELVGQDLLDKKFPQDKKNFIIHPQSFAQNALMLIISTQNPESKKILLEFNEALMKIKKNGLYDAIIKRYQKK